MPRALDPPLATAVSSNQTRPFYAATFHFARGAQPVRLWTGLRPIVIEGETYQGVGAFGQVGAVSETTETKAVGLALTLSGIPSNIVNDAIYSDFQGDFVDLYIGNVDADGDLDGRPFQIFRGIIDNMIIEESGVTTRITLKVETTMLELERPRESRYTPEEQQRRFPGDRGFDYVAGLQTKEIQWG